jgi:hypothetical protein
LLFHAHPYRPLPLYSFPLLQNGLFANLV